MTSEEAFEAWWTKSFYGSIPTVVGYPKHEHDLQREAWLAAWRQGRAAGLQEAADYIARIEPESTSTMAQMMLELRRRAAIRGQAG